MKKTPLNNRRDFVILFDVTDGNPNGDPDAGNMPRVDPETQQGLVTDVCLKRKIRDTVELLKQNAPGYDIFVKSSTQTVLNTVIKRAHEEVETDLDSTQDAEGYIRKKKGVAQGEEIGSAREYMCEHFFDVRAFGAVMSTGSNAGQVRGAVQITFARSVDAITVLEHTITTCAARVEEKSFVEQVGIQGHKYTVPYGLYRCHGFVSANLAVQTGFTEADLALLWDAILSMFEHDRSAARGNMNMRGLYVYKHDSPLGNAPAMDLFPRIRVTGVPGMTVPRKFGDYRVEIEEKDLPKNVELIRLLG